MVRPPRQRRSTWSSRRGSCRTRRCDLVTAPRLPLARRLGGWPGPTARPARLRGLYVWGAARGKRRGGHLRMTPRASTPVLSALVAVFCAVPMTLGLVDADGANAATVSAGAAVVGGGD